MELLKIDYGSETGALNTTTAETVAVTQQKIEQIISVSRQKPTWVI